MNKEIKIILDYCEKYELEILYIDVVYKTFIVSQKDGTPTKCSFNEIKELEILNKKCNHRDENNNPTIEYESIYEMRSSDMYCTQCGKSGSRTELMNDI